MDGEEGGSGPAEFRPRPLATRRSSGLARLAAIAWLLVVGGLLLSSGLGRLLGGIADVPSSGDPGGVARPSGAAEAAGSLGSAAVGVLGSPATGAASAAAGSDLVAGSLGVPEDLVGFSVIESRGRVEVSGTVGAHAVASLTVALEDSSGVARLTKALWVVDPDGGVRPARTRTFAVLLDVPRGLVVASSYVAVTAFDGIGATMGVVRAALGPGSPKVPIKVGRTWVR